MKSGKGFLFCLSILLIFDLLHAQPFNWVEVASSNAPRFEGMSAVVNDKMYVFTGLQYNNTFVHQFVCEAYDPATDDWSILSPIPIPVTHVGVAVSGNEVWLIGGFNNSGVVINNVQIYNTITDSWTAGPPLPVNRAAGAAVLLDNKMHYFGGLLPDRNTGTGEHYVLDVNNQAAGWTNAAPMPEPRNHFSGIVIDGKIYAAGGQFLHDGPAPRIDQDFLHVYDPGSDSWTELANLPAPRSHFEPGTFVHHDKLYAVGGKSISGNGITDITEYDPATDTWTKVGDLPVPLFAPAAKVINNQIIVANGGLIEAQYPQSTVYIAPFILPVVDDNGPNPVRITTPQDGAGYITPANITILAEADIFGDEGEPTYFNIVNPATSWRQFKLGYDPANIWNPRWNVTDSGNNTLEITLKDFNGNAQWHKIQIRPQGASGSPVNLSSYVNAIGGVGNDWVKIVIPISDFHPSVPFNQLSYIEFPHSSGAAPFELGISEIKFTGGATPFLWFGGTKTDNAHNGNGGNGEMTASLVPGSTSMVSISKLEFFRNNSFLGEDFTEPYSFNWNNVQPGNYALTVKAINSNDSSVFSHPVNVTVDNPVPQPPVVQITFPKNNQVFAAPANIVIAATAHVNDGNILFVEFYEGTNLLGIDTASPFSFSWNNVPVGTYLISAVTTDDDNNTAADAITIMVTEPNDPPVVSIINPADNAVYYVPTDITINVSASDPDGSVVKVEFYEGSNLLGTDTTYPYSFDWIQIAAGSYMLSAKAIDDKGAYAYSAIINVIVLDTTNSPPSVHITNPIHGAILTAPAELSIHAEALDTDGYITRVEFYENANLVETVFAYPYSFYRKIVMPGNYNYIAVAFDDRNISAASSTVNILVDNPPPGNAFVALTHPADGSSFSALADITLTAEATGFGSDGEPTYLSITNPSTGWRRFKLGHDPVNIWNPKLNVTATGNHQLEISLRDFNGTTEWNKLKIQPQGSSTTVTFAPYVNALGGLGNDWVQIIIPLADFGSNVDFTQLSYIELPYSAGAAPFHIGISEIKFTGGSQPFTWFDADKNDNAHNGNGNSGELIAEVIQGTPSGGAGGIDRIEFYEGNTLLGVDHNAPFSFNWTNVAEGIYNLIAVAIGTNDAEIVSNIVQVTVAAQNNISPVVHLTQPAHGASFEAPAEITITADASDPDGAITKVEFYEGNTLINTVLASPYAFTWNNVPEGNYMLKAIAYDNDNAFTESAAINLTVYNPVLNLSPEITITSPADGAVFLKHSEINISVSTNDPDGNVTKVDFFEATNYLGTDSIYPFQWVWEVVNSGIYLLTAKATDNNHAVSTSSPVQIHVTDSMESPSSIITITNPSDGATFLRPLNLRIEASVEEDHTSEAFLNITAPDKGWRKLKLGYNTDNLWSPRWNVIASGNDTLEILLKDYNENAEWHKLQIRPQGNSGNPVYISNYLSQVGGTIGNQWVRLKIPLSDFNGAIDFTQLSFIELPYSVGADVFELAIKEVKFTGSSSPFVWFGESKTDNYHDGFGGGGQLIAELIENSDNTLSLSKVEFYNGSTFLGEDHNEPYSIIWSNPSIGNHNLIARAVFDNNTNAASNPVGVTISEAVGDTLTVIVNFNSIPTGYSIQKAPLKYNKDFAYSLTLDDGASDGYTVAYPLLNGGYIDLDNTHHPGLYYTDGCGNDIPFKAGLAWYSVNSFGLDLHTSRTVANKITWAELQEIYNSGWDVLNHSYSHAANGSSIDYNYQVTENINHVFTKTGIEMTHFVIPAGDLNYTDYALNNGMKTVFNQGGIDFIGGYKIAIVKADEGDIQTENLKSMRKFLDNVSYQESNIIIGIDSVAAISTGGNHYWYNDATHGVGTTYNGSLLYPLFKYYMEYVEATYGKSGSDRVWMAPLQEVHEYLTVRDNSIITSTLNGNELEIKIILTDVPDDLRRYCLSLIVNSNTDFSTVSADEKVNRTFKGSGATKLINLDWSVPNQTWVANKQTQIRNPTPGKVHLQGNLKIFPNPVEEIIYLQVENEQETEYLISVTNIIGQLALSTKINAPEGNSIVQLDLSNYDLRPGVYFLEVEGDLSREVVKFVKE